MCPFPRAMRYSRSRFATEQRDRPMNTWRRARIVAIGLALAHLVGCGGASNTATNERQRPLIGVSLLTQSHTFYKDLEAALRTEAATRGLDLNVVACEMDPARQASQIEDF